MNKKPVKNLSNVLCPSCSYCESTRIEEYEDVVKCLDCGMGKYKQGRHKKYSKAPGKSK